MYRLPGSEALHKVLLAADKHGGPKNDIDAAKDAIESFDHFVHTEIGNRNALDAWIGSTIPESMVLDTPISGVVDRDDPDRANRQLRIHEPIQSLGINRTRSADLGNSSALLAHMSSQKGWNISEFRGYRCRVRYPIYGSQICMEFSQ